MFISSTAVFSIISDREIVSLEITINSLPSYSRSVISESLVSVVNFREIRIRHFLILKMNFNELFRSNAKRYFTRTTE